MKPLKTRREFPLQVLGLAGMTAAVAAAQPKQTEPPQPHPNLAAAQDLSQQAYDKIVAAQQANEWDMQGHAHKAKTLLAQANTQLKLAAKLANKRSAE
jgi:hypothetical protein